MSDERELKTTDQGPPAPVTQDLVKPRPSAEDHQRALTRIEWLEKWLENAIAIPGTNVRVGLDALVGLVPVAGDATTAIMSLYLLWEARRFGLPAKAMLLMMVNIVLDLFAGLLPIVGDLADFAWRANTRNLKIIKEHLHATKALPEDSDSTSA